MTNINNSANFLSLTNPLNKLLTFEELDINKDGQVTQNEYAQALKNAGVNVDTVELSTVEKKPEEELLKTQEDPKLLEQKIEIDKRIEKLKSIIAKDFAGDESKYIKDILADLASFKNEYIENYEGKTDKLAASFETALMIEYHTSIRTKYNRLAYEERRYANLQKQTEKALGDVVEELGLESEMVDFLKEKLAAQIGEFLEDANAYDVSRGLKSYITSFIKRSNNSKMDVAISTYERSCGFAKGWYYQSDKSEKSNAHYLEQLKEQVTTFLNSAIDKLVEVNLGGVYVNSTDDIQKALDKYTDFEVLVADMDKLIQKLQKDDTSLLSEVKAENDVVKSEKENEILNGISIDNFEVVNPFENDLGSWNMKNYGYNDPKMSVRTFLNNDVKENFVEQVKEKLKEQGLDFEKVDTIFDLSFEQSILELQETSTQLDSFPVKREDIAGEFSAIFNRIFVQNLEDVKNAQNEDDFATNLITNGALEVTRRMDYSNGNYDIHAINGNLGKSVRSYINSRIKQSFKNELTQKLKDRGMKFESIATAFNNAFEQSITATLETPGLLSGNRIKQFDIENIFTAIFNIHFQELVAERTLKNT